MCKKALKKGILIAALLLALFVSGFAAGWWLNSPGFDFLCSKQSVYMLGKDIEGEGISIKAGRQINLRSCEYANRFSIELYSEKGNYPDVFVPINSAPNVGNHGAEQYSVNPIEE